MRSTHKSSDQKRSNMPHCLHKLSSISVPLIDLRRGEGFSVFRSKYKSISFDVCKGFGWSDILFHRFSLPNKSQNDLILLILNE